MSLNIGPAIDFIFRHDHLGNLTESVNLQVIQKPNRDKLLANKLDCSLQDDNL